MGTSGNTHGVSRARKPAPTARPINESSPLFCACCMRILVASVLADGGALSPVVVGLEVAASPVVCGNSCGGTAVMAATWSGLASPDATVKATGTSTAGGFKQPRWLQI